MRVTFLGTGSSVGVPIIGCRCRVCTSDDPRNTRLRQSLWIRDAEASILVDASPDFREQCLRHDIRRVDAILLTHAHADHILGLDETRVFAYWQKGAIPVYGSPRTLEGVLSTIRRREGASPSSISANCLANSSWAAWPSFPSRRTTVSCR